MSSDSHQEGTSSPAGPHGATGQDKRVEDKHPSVAYWRLYTFAAPLDWLLIGLGTLGACVHGAAIPVFFIFFGKLIDEFGANYNNPTRLGHGVSKYALYFVYLGLVILVSAWLEVACWTQTGERQTGRMRVEYLRAMLGQNVGFFDTDTTAGEIVSGISSDTALVQEAIGAKAGNYLHYMARFVAGFAVGFSSVWKLTLVTLAVVPAIALAGGLYAYTMTGLTSKSQKAYAKAGDIAEESISQVRTVYSFVQEERAVEEYTNALRTTVKLGSRSGLAKGIGVGATYGLTIAAWALLLWYAGVLVRRGETNGGQAFTTILNVVIAGLSLGNAAPNLAAFGKGQAAGYNILEMIKRKPGMNSESGLGRGIKLESVEGHIQLRNVAFSYPSRPEQIIFRDLCLDIPAGKTVAVVGSSGSGKSTVISLIERFYDPQSGQILLDGYPIQELELKWLRGRIGLVNQEPALFATSIRENILFGKEDATDAEIEAAARASDAHTFVKQLPSGYETHVGEKGVQLSGGQKQRIALARAMVKNPAVLLLDEATSALDAGSEKAVQEALDRLMIGRTTLVVAHRLSTVQGADTIAVVHEGQVVETGSHEELLSKLDGFYTSLVKLQASTKDKSLSDVDGRHSMSRHSRGSSLSQKTFSFRASVHSEADTLSNAEELQRLKSLPKPSYWRLLKLNAPEWKYGAVGALGAVLAGAETPFFAYGITQALVSFYTPDREHQKRKVASISVIFTIASALTVVIYVLEHYFFGVMGERLTMRVRRSMFSNMLRSEVGWFDREENNSSLLSSKLSSDATMVRAAVGDRLCTLTQNLALVVTGFVMAFVLQWKLTLVILALFPLMISAHITEHLFLKGFGVDLAAAYHRCSMVAGEAVANIRTVAAFCAEDRVASLFCRELQVPRRSAAARGQIAGLGYGTSQCCLYASYGLALWYASTLIRRGEASFDHVIKAFVLLIFTAFGVAETLSLAPDIVRGSTAVAAVLELMDRESEIPPDEPSGKDPPSPRPKGDLELRRVSFSYPTRPEVAVLKELSLKVKAGRSLALVGASGCGKSSILSLVARFYDPSSGVVCIDGNDIRRFKLRALRRHIGLVQQEPALFATTIYRNILYGDPAASQSDVMAAAKSANALAFVSALPQGFETEVGERGVQLSGGQKQRVAIARAVLKNPALLLLDEATSALDAQSERVVQDALDRLMRGRTTVLVAHRLSTVQNADVIAVIHDGQVVEQGSHAELIARRGGAYARLVHLQTTDS